MKKITYFKLVLDLLMAVTFVLLFNDRVLGGLTFHEMAGVGISFAFITHVLLNVQWIKKVTVRLFDRKLPGKTRFGYLLNLLLLLTMTFIVVSGILISRVVFPNVRIVDTRWFQSAHISVSFLVLILVGVHAGLHWRWVMNAMKSIFNKASHGTLGLVLKVATAAILAFGGYQMYATDFLQHLNGIGVVMNLTQALGPGGGRPAGEASMKGGDFGDRPGRPEGGGAGPMRSRPEAGGPGGANPLDVLLTYLGIMGVIVIVTYYLDKWGTRKKPSKDNLLVKA